METQNSHPAWWNPKAKFRTAINVDRFRRILNLATNTTDMALKQTADTNLWVANWIIEHDENGCDKGQRVYTREIVNEAFDPDGQDLHITGYLIKQGRHLNLPGPGTGQKGDPNLSIWLSDELYRALQELLPRWCTANVVDFAAKKTGTRS